MVINNLGAYLFLLFEEKIFHFQSDLKFSQVFPKNPFTTARTNTSREKRLLISMLISKFIPSNCHFPEKSD